jgi:hypothetical protein
LAAETWVEVPTGSSYALASLYFLNTDDSYYMTAKNLDATSPLIVEPCCYGGEDYRTWYFTGTPMGPIQSPSPSTSAPSTSAYVRGAREHYQLTA